MAADTNTNSEIHQNLGQVFTYSPHERLSNYIKLSLSNKKARSSKRAFKMSVCSLNIV